MNPTASTQRTKRTTKVVTSRTRTRAIDFLESIGYKADLVPVAGTQAAGIKAEKRDLDLEAFCAQGGVNLLWVRPGYVILNEAEWLAEEAVIYQFGLNLHDWYQIDARQRNLAIEAYKAGEMEHVRLFLNVGLSRIGN